jgi:DNA topoisomerase I
MKPDLMYVSDTDPGITRRKYGKGFRYIDHKGRSIDCHKELSRIRSLAVPPAYRNVWICRLANGHLQATGLDDLGRKQYRYHQHWTEFRSLEKFDGLATFGRGLPKVRRKIEKILANARRDEIFGKDVALALLVRLMDHTAMRVGGRSRTSQGATTLLMRNVKYGNGTLKLKYTAKGGKKVQSTVSDRRLQKILEKIHDLPGKRLFQYIGQDKEVHPLDSGDVNTWLKTVMGQDNVSAKMFRTWHGSVAALEALRIADKATIKIACEAASDILCNTPAIARKSYVHPLVLQLAEEGNASQRIRQLKAKKAQGLNAAEQRLLALLD